MSIFQAVAILNEESSCLFVNNPTSKEADRAVSNLLDPLLMSKKVDKPHTKNCLCVEKNAEDMVRKRTNEILGDDWVSRITSEVHASVENMGLGSYERDCVLHSKFEKAHEIEFDVYRELNAQIELCGTSSVADPDCVFCDGLGTVQTKQNPFGRLLTWSVVGRYEKYFAGTSDDGMPPGFCALCRGARARLYCKPPDFDLIASAEQAESEADGLYRCFCDADFKPISASEARVFYESGKDVYCTCPRCDGGPPKEYRGEFATVARLIAMIEADPNNAPAAVTIESPDEEAVFPWYECRKANLSNNIKTWSPEYWVSGLSTMLRTLDPNLVCISVECSD